MFTKIAFQLALITDFETSAQILNSTYTLLELLKVRSGEASPEQIAAKNKKFVNAWESAWWAVYRGIARYRGQQLSSEPPDEPLRAFIEEYLEPNFSGIH